MAHTPRMPTLGGEDAKAYTNTRSCRLIYMMHECFLVSTNLHEMKKTKKPRMTAVTESNFLAVASEPMRLGSGPECGDLRGEHSSRSPGGCAWRFGSGRQVRRSAQLGSAGRPQHLKSRPSGTCTKVEPRRSARPLRRLS